jgi:hypothetical protein
VKAPKARAGGSLASRPASGLPFFLMPQAVPAAENPRGKATSCMGSWLKSGVGVETRRIGAKSAKKGCLSGPRFAPGAKDETSDKSIK